MIQHEVGRVSESRDLSNSKLLSKWFKTLLKSAEARTYVLAKLSTKMFDFNKLCSFNIFDLYNSSHE